MTNHEKEAYLEHSISLSEDLIREQVECARENAKAFLANLDAAPANLRRALDELDTLVQELQNNLRVAEANDNQNRTRREALKLLKA